MMCKNIFTISKATFVELLKTKVMYIALILAFIQIIFSVASIKLTYGIGPRLLVDFSLGIQSILLTILSVFLGVNLIFEDIAGKFIHVLLSRPIKKYEYIFGKITGLMFILIFVASILTVTSLVLFEIYNCKIDTLLIHAFLTLFFKSSILIILSVILSLIFEKVLAVFFTTSILIAGYSVPEILKSKSIFLADNQRTILHYFSYSIPDFNKLDLTRFIGTNIDLSTTTLINIYAYAIVYFTIIFFFTLFIFKNREL